MVSRVGMARVGVGKLPTPLHLVRLRSSGSRSKSDGYRQFYELRGS